jgi:hypothetical protein
MAKAIPGIILCNAHVSSLGFERIVNIERCEKIIPVRIIKQSSRVDAFTTGVLLKRMKMIKTTVERVVPRIEKPVEIIDSVSVHLKISVGFLMQTVKSMKNCYTNLKK